jgi:hypothetical protein
VTRRASLRASAAILPRPQGRGSIPTRKDVILHMRTHRALLLWLSLLASSAVAQTHEIQVERPTPAALQAAIDACPRSYSSRERGCQIRLPSGTIRGHWRIGGDTGATVQVGVCLIGQGPGHGSGWPSGKPAASGTTLVYDGPPGGALLDFVGGDYPCVRDLTLAMDGAAVGLRFSAGKTPIQNPMLERVTIAGDMTKPAGIGLLITGAQKNDQVDALLANELKIDDVDVGIEVDSHQAVTNRIGPGSKISAKSAAVRVRGGSLSLDGVLTQCRTANCCTYDLLEGHGYFRVRDGYHEIGYPPAQNAKLVCLNRGSPDGVGSWQMVSITDSYINVQCDASAGPCSIDLVNGRSNVAVVFRDNSIISTQPVVAHIGRTFARLVFGVPAMPVGATPTGRLVWQGNSVIPAMGGIRAEIGPGARVEALSGDGKRIWNDLDLDGRWDEGEPSSASRP